MNFLPRAATEIVTKKIVVPEHSLYHFWRVRKQIRHQKLSPAFRKFTLLIAVSFLSALIWISSQPAQANVVGVDTQNFNPITSGLDFVTVQSSEPLEPGIMNLGLFLNYAVNSLPNYTDTATQSRSKARDRLLSSDVNIGMGLRKGWDVGLSVPAVLSQQVEADVFKGVFEKTGMTDIRLNTKIRLFGNKDGGLATIFTLELPQVQNNPFYGTGNSPTYNLELAADTTFNKVALGFNLGYRVRNTGGSIAGVPISPIGNMMIASMAASYLFSKIDTKLIMEIFASQPTANTATQSDRELSTAELLFGIKHDVSTQIAIHTGVSTGLSRGNFSPDYRAYVGMNWAMGPIWSTKAPMVERVAQPVPVRTIQPPPPVVASKINVVDDGSTENEPELPDWTRVAPAPEQKAPVAEVATVNTTPDQADYFRGRAPEKRELFVVRNLNFKTGSAKIPIDFKNYLEKFAEYLNRKPPFRRLVITGHTDSVGDPKTNLELSRSRAFMVKRALSELFNIPAEKIEVQGYGQERPIADNGNFQGRSTNRRVEFFIER